MRTDTDLTHVVEAYVVENGTKYKTLPPTQDMFEARKDKTRLTTKKSSTLITFQGKKFTTRELDVIDDYQNDLYWSSYDVMN